MSGGYKDYGLVSDYFTTKFNSSDKSLNLALAMNDGTLDRAHKQAWGDFDRFYSVDLQNELPSGRHYIFMCRPDLYLLKSGSTELCDASRVSMDPYFIYLAQFHPEIIASLTTDSDGMKSLAVNDASGEIYKGLLKSYKVMQHDFIPYLTSRAESLQIPDYKIESSSIVQPYTKYTIPYTTSAIGSTTGGNFTITFREDRYYSIHKLFYAWIYYQNNVMRNIFSPKETYIAQNALDYATSIYDFIVDETGENIIYWTKYTGCVPTNVPMSDLSFNRGGDAETKVGIDFDYFLCEHMDLNILVDFQYNSLGSLAMRTTFKEKELFPFKLEETVPIYDSDTFLGRNFVGRPIIICGKHNGEKIFKLRWLP